MKQNLCWKGRNSIAVVRMNHPSPASYVFKVYEYESNFLIKVVEVWSLLLVITLGSLTRGAPFDPVIRHSRGRRNFNKKLSTRSESAGFQALDAIRFEPLDAGKFVIENPCWSMEYGVAQSVSSVLLEETKQG